MQLHARVPRPAVEGEFFGGASYRKLVEPFNAMIELATSAFLESSHQIAFTDTSFFTACAAPKHWSNSLPALCASARFLVCVVRAIQACSLVRSRQYRGDGQNDRTGGRHCCRVADPAGVRSLRFASPQAASLAARSDTTSRNIRHQWRRCTPVTMALPTHRSSGRDVAWLQMRLPKPSDHALILIELIDRHRAFSWAKAY